jgi:polyvinyl alcohol dehydrogenase (cytochrome)
MMIGTTSIDNIHPDQELVAQSLTGNRDAFGLIVSRYQSLVCSITYSATGCLSRSEDLAQETFLTAWKQLGQLQEPAKLRAWLCGIARNLATWLAVMIVRYTRQTGLLRVEEQKRHPELFQNEIPSLERSRGDYRSKTKLFGVPLVHIQYGVPGAGAPDWAVGWIAVGDRAAGILFALGGMAVGGISVGTLSAGIISVGAVSVGLLAMGAVAVGGVAVGAMCFGLVAAGGFAVAWTAGTGALAVVHDFAIGGNVIARHANDAVARELFERFHAAGIFRTLLLVLTALSLGPVGWMAWRTRKHSRATAVLLCATLIPFGAFAQATEKDWPMYNRDVLGTRHNKGETAIGPANAGQLVEKWRFPAKGSGQEIGVVHATPVVVAGCVYFGTATDSTFYKLSPDGKVRWTYRNPDRAATQGSETNRNVRFQPALDGIFSSALVTEDTVFFGDTGGRFYALDRKTGAERWKLNARGEGFPGAHPINVFMASPILTDGKLIVAGGTLEQVFSPFPGYKGCTGRGFVMALEPKTGRILWKYDVGPKPEPFAPPITLKDSWGDHVFYFGPATSSVWSTPSFDAESGTIFFGTDVNTAPRRPTKDNPRIDTRESCAVIAVNVRDGSEKWVTQISPGDIWNNGMRAYDPKEGRYKDQSVGDTPKIYTIPMNGTPTKVVGVGCKNGGFYVLQATDGRIVDHTPIYTGPPRYPLVPEPDKRLLALPSPIGGLQTGCATDGTSIFSNGIDALRLGSQEKQSDSAVPPTSGRVVALSLDTRTERWRHERPKVTALGGPAPTPIYKNVGDPVASGIAVANGVLYFTTVASGKLIALDSATGATLKEFDIGPVWSGPSVSNGRVYVGTGNTLFTPMDYEAYFPKKNTGVLYSFGLPGEDAVGRLGVGKE